MTRFWHKDGFIIYVQFCVSVVVGKLEVHNQKMRLDAMERILQFCLIMGNDLKPYDSFNCYFRESSVHPSVHYETRLILVRIIRVLDPNSACIGRERGICPGHVTNPLQFEKLSTVFQDCFVVQSVRLLINTYPGRVSSRPTD